MIPPLPAQVVAGQYASAALRDAQNMMSLIAQWDLLRYSEKLRESAKGQASRFHEVPGFEPSFCGPCQDWTLLDFTDDPEGACYVCGSLSSTGYQAAAA